MLVLTLLAALLAPADSKISMLDGQSHSGPLSAITASDVEITENGALIKLPIDDVMAIEFPVTAPADSGESQMLFFSDGSEIHGTSIARTAKSLTAQTVLLGAVEAKVDAVHAVRLQADNPSFTQQWNTFLKRDSDKDNLVVVKRDGSGLDFLAGIVSSVTAANVEFLLDGETIPVPSERVYGIVFGRPPGSKTGTSGPHVAIQLTSIAGDVLNTKTIVLEGDQLKAESAWGQMVSIPLNQLRKIDLSSGRIQFLSEMPALVERFDGIDPENSLFAGLIAPEQQKLLFGPQRNMTIERQSRLRLRGREFSKGLCIHSRSEMQWELERRFSALECVVGIDDEVAFNGSHAVALKITGDDNVLFEKLIATTDDPIPLRLPLDGVSMLTILVDFGDGSSVCDWLDIADGRLVIAKEKP
ncbi:MAG: NPCBM/NEW2 domain-containing protein [Fuerstia sp.]|nr:NPCBM/NEW2 domain-containing protein [Fuerstiella sp.]